MDLPGPRPADECVGHGGGVRTDFLRGEPHGVDGTFNTKIAKDYVEGLALNSTFTLYASVSFDGGQSYIAFKSLALKVVA